MIRSSPLSCIPESRLSTTSEEAGHSCFLRGRDAGSRPSSLQRLHPRRSYTPLPCGASGLRRLPEESRRVGGRELMTDFIESVASRKRGALIFLACGVCMCGWKRGNSIDGCVLRDGSRGDDGSDGRSPGGQWLSPHVYGRGSSSQRGIRRLIPARRSRSALGPLLAMMVGATVLAPCACQSSSINVGGPQVSSQQDAGAGIWGGEGGGGETRARGTTRVGLLAMGVFWKGLFRDAEIMAWGNLDITTTTISFSRPLLLSLLANHLNVCCLLQVCYQTLGPNSKLESRRTLGREPSTVDCDQ